MFHYLEIESLDLLIKAVQEYEVDLRTNKQFLVNAAIVCDAAMGSDDIAKKHIERLNQALVKLEKAAQLASDVAKALKTDRQLAISVYEDEG